MDKFLPDIYQKSIYTINYAKLKDRGIKCILFDLDNTLSPTNMKEPSQKLIDLINELKDMGFKIIIFSNSHKKRIKPFKDGLMIDAAHSCMKPFKKKFIKIMQIYGFNESEIAIVGDQLLTDILGGNKVDITTILINPISKKDGVFTILNRMIEKRIFKKFKKNNIIEKGTYYE